MEKRVVPFIFVPFLFSLTKGHLPLAIGPSLTDNRNMIRFNLHVNDIFECMAKFRGHGWFEITLCLCLDALSLA